MPDLGKRPVPSVPGLIMTESTVFVTRWKRDLKLNCQHLTVLTEASWFYFIFALMSVWICMNSWVTDGETVLVESDKPGRVKVKENKD